MHTTPHLHLLLVIPAPFGDSTPDGVVVAYTVTTDEDYGAALAIWLAWHVAEGLGVTPELEDVHVVRAGQPHVLPRQRSHVVRIRGE